MAEEQITEEEIRKAEAEIKAKEIEAELAKTKQMEQLIDEAVSRGRDHALSSLKEQQEKERQEAERAALVAKANALEADLKRTQEASMKKFEEMSAKLATLEARPKGINKNESPFAQENVQANPVQGLSREGVKAIEQASMEAFYHSTLGRPAPQ